MGEQIPDSQRLLTDNTDFVSWTKVSGARDGDFFYIAVGLPTDMAVLGSNAAGVTVVVDGKGTKGTLKGSVDESETYNIVGFHGPGKPLRFA